MITFRRLLTFFLFLLAEESLAQVNYSFPPIDYIYQNWTNKNGLIQNSVADIVQDEHGYLWLATEEGVLRFDGTNFKVINQENTPGVHASTFYDLCVSRRGIWAASLNGVIYLHNDSIKSYDFRHLLKNSWISAISEDENGTLWVGTNNGELYNMKDQKIVKHQESFVEKSLNIQVLLNAAEGISIGTNRGLFRITKDKKIVTVSGLGTQNIRAVEADKHGALWIGTKDHGLYHLMGEKITHYSRKDGLGDLFVRSLGISPTGQLWIGTSSAGLQILNNGKFENVKDNGISNDGIKKIFFSEPNLIWLGTPASGLIQMKPANIQRIRKKDGLADNVILPIYQHPNGEVWIGTAGQGLNRIKNGKIYHYSKRDGLASEIVISLYGAANKVYIGTVAGLNIFNLKTDKFEKMYTVSDGLADNVVQSVLVDSRGRSWISTPSGGVHLLEKDKIRRFQLPSEIANAEMTKIFEDSKENIWVGSTGEGIINIKPGKGVKHYKSILGGTSNIVYDFYEDPEGAIWLGTEAGLLHFQTKKIFNKSNGLKFNGIYRIIDDGEGYLWLSGNFGLQRISIQELLREKSNGKKTSKIMARLFNTSDGMANSEANGNISPAGWKMNDGKLWFPTVEGISVVQPSRKEKVRLGFTKINSIQYGNTILTHTTDLVIPPNVYNLSINYTNINFNNPHETTYYYRLRGLTNAWENAGARQTAYFTSLDPGRYTFEVKAEQYGVWSEVSSVSFTVEPVFYQTLWFRSLLGILLLLSGFFAHKLYSSTRQKTILKELVYKRTQELQDRNNEVEKINKQLHTSRQQYQSLFFQNPNAVFSLDLEGNIITANKIASALTGYSVEDLVKMSFIFLVPKRSVSKILKNLKTTITGETQNYQIGVLTADGSSRFVDITNLPIVVSGDITGIYAVMKDITEEKFLEDKLVLANERFRLANKATSDSIWDWDLTKGRVDRAENFLEVQLGYTVFKPSAYFSAFGNLVHPLDKDKNAAELVRVLKDRSEDFWEEDVRLLRSDNTYAYIQSRGYIIRDSKGKAIRMIGASRDITKRKLEEQQLKMMELVITHTTDAVMIMKADPEGVKIIFINEAYTSMSGYSLAEIYGKRPPILRGEGTNPEELARFQQAVENWKPYKTEALNYKKNGETFWNDINMVPVRDSEGNYTHWVSIERDITERKQQMIAIEEQNRSLKEIAWIQSHTVRAPLSRMMGIISLLEEECLDDQEVPEFLQYLKNSGTELDDIIRDIVKKSQVVDSSDSPVFRTTRTYRSS